MQILPLSGYLFRLGNVAPAGGVAGTAEIVLDAVLEDTCLHLLPYAHVLLVGILLGAEDDGLGAVFAVDSVDGLVETFHLLVALCVVVDEVRLHTVVGTDAHDDDARTLVVVALTVDALDTPDGRLHDLLGGVGGRQQPLLAHVPVLGQVLAEMIGVDEHADGLRDGLLLAEFLGTAGGEVGDAGVQDVLVCHHARKRARGADALFLRHVLHGDAVLAVELLPGADGSHVVQRGPYPGLGMAGEVEGGLDARGLQTRRIAMANAPHLLDVVALQGLDALFVCADHATVVVALVVLGVVAGHLRQCLRGGDADADGHARGLPDECREVFAPLLQRGMTGGLQIAVHAREVAEAFVDAVAVERRGRLAHE